MKVTRAPGVQQDDLFSSGNIVYGDMRLPKWIRTGDCKTGAQFCSRMKADFTWVFVIIVSESGDDPESGTRTATLWKHCDRYGGSQWCYRFNFVWRLNVINGCTLTALRYRAETLDPVESHSARAMVTVSFWCKISAGECKDYLNSVTFQVID